MMENKMQWTPECYKSMKVDPTIDRWQVCAEGAILNCVTGIVQSHHVGLVRASVRVSIMERTDLRVKWPIDERRCCVVGQRVVAAIPAEAVRLEAGIFRRSKQRRNRWIGRIVLVESGDAEPAYTVKLLGEDWTLKAYGPVDGARQPSKVWDVVNVVVDPQSVNLLIVDWKSWYQGVDHRLGL